MKLIIILLFISSSCFSQKQYSFDYLIEYEVTHFKDSIKPSKREFRKEDKTFIEYHLTNSKENSYSAVLTDFDSLHYTMFLRDEKGIHSEVKILKSVFHKVQRINIDCKNVAAYYNPNKYQVKNYDFFNLNDTIIQGKSYGMYTLESIKPKRTKRKKLGTLVYIFDKETSFHLPILEFATAYEEWKSEENIPNGIFQQRLLKDYYGRLTTKKIMKNYKQINKIVVISGDCDSYLD